MPYKCLFVVICMYDFNNNNNAIAKSLQSCPTVCDPMDGSPPGSSVQGILQARILEWVAISFSKVLILLVTKFEGGC